MGLSAIACVPRFRATFPTEARRHGGKRDRYSVFTKIIAARLGPMKKLFSVTPCLRGEVLTCGQAETRAGCPSEFAWPPVIFPLPIAIFLLLFPARLPETVGERIAGLTFLCRQSDIASSFSRLLRFSSRATLRRNAGEPFRFRGIARARGDASKNSCRPWR